MLKGFSDKKIVSLLSVHSIWGKRACREIIRRKNDFIPLLIGILDQTIDNIDIAFDNSHQHIPAALLLAQMREPYAYSRLVKLMDYDDENIEFLWEEFITEHYVKMLRDTYNGDSSLLHGVIEKRSVDPFSRSTAVYALGMHYFDGHISREKIAGYFRRLIHEVYTGKLNDDDEIVLSSVVDCIREQQLEELIEDAKTVYARNSIDKFLCGDYEEYTTKFSDPLYRAKDQHIDDAIQLLQQWRWFEEETSPEKSAASDFYGYGDNGDEPSWKIDIGRNEPCPCGSGKKYKNCCLGRDFYQW